MYGRVGRHLIFFWMGGRGKSKCNCVGGCLLQIYNWIGGCTLNEKFIAMLSCFQLIKTLQMPKENHVFSTGDFIYLARKSYVNARVFRTVTGSQYLQLPDCLPPVASMADKWNINSVCHWLQSNGLDKFAASFRGNIC